MSEKKKEFPHSFVIVFAIILFAVLLTWIIPAGEYVRLENADGIKVVDPNQFQYVGRTPVNPLMIPMYIVKGFCNYILPTSTALMGIISACNIPYDRWMRFMWKMFAIWFVTGVVLLIIAQLINYGPM